MTIEADPGGVGKIRGDFDEQGAEVLMCDELLLKLRWRGLMNPSEVSLPTKFLQPDWQFGHDASNFSRRITAK